MTPEEMDVLLKKLEDSGLCDLEKIYSEIEAKDLDVVIRRLDSLAVGWTRRAAYLERRFLGGTHKEAVRAQNSKAKALRRAFGYTYPEQEITF